MRRGVHALPHRPRRTFQPDHAPAISTLEDGPWIGFNWRYDSGLVAGPVPCAGGNCANGPNGTDTVVDVPAHRRSAVSGRTFCGRRVATPPTRESHRHADQRAAGSVPRIAIRFEAPDQIPAPGTENDDHNPPRIAPRNLFDLAVGDDNLFHGDRYKWSLALDGRQRHQQVSALQLPLHVQRHALRHAAGVDRRGRLPLLAGSGGPGICILLKFQVKCRFPAADCNQILTKLQLTPNYNWPRLFFPVDNGLQLGDSCFAFIPAR